MGTLHRLFKLHLGGEKNEVLRASSHRYGVGQGDLPGFVDEEEIERIFPLGPGEKPCGARCNARRVVSTRITRGFDVRSTRIGCDQGSSRLTTDVKPAETAATLPRRVAAGSQKIHDCLVAIGGHSDSFTRGEKRSDNTSGGER